MLNVDTVLLNKAMLLNISKI